ncbi:MAG: hypothetical protein DMF84_11885 [Acidobacteria bacterium]|nr:MAG: hypothetical protein DMF84_11885 [Acidobacteriota bacterium]
MSQRQKSLQSIGVAGWSSDKFDALPEAAQFTNHLARGDRNLKGTRARRAVDFSQVCGTFELRSPTS